MDSSKLKILAIIVVASFAAIYLGVAAATAQKEAIAWMVGVLGIIFFLALGRNIWVIIPISLALIGNINLIPGSPTPWWMATMAVAAISVMRFLMRKHDLDFRFTWMDFAILLQMLAIGQAFIRNPTGLAFLGGDVVGGRPYVIFVFAALAFTLLSFVRTDLRTIKLVVIFTILMSVVDGALFLTGMYIPALAGKIFPIYSGVNYASAASGAEIGEATDTRIIGAKYVGEALGTAAFTIFRPLTALNPFRLLPFLLMVSSMGFIMVSGFRSIMFKIAAIAIVSSLVRRKPVDVMIGGVLVAFALTFLVTTQTAKILPFGAQRILSELPFDVGVDSRATVDADKSSEWRFEMWRLALFTDRYIQNKWLGDGFGYRTDELRAALDSLQGDNRRSSGQVGIDAMMAKGSYHGFHVETIRMTGAFGLLCALVGLGIFFRYALIQIRYFKGRPEWGYILYICIPFLIYPFYLMLIFGQYKIEFPTILVSSVMIKILDNIRVRELAAARVEASAPGTSQTPVRSLPTGRFQQPAMNRR
jgi:hypothetical protein